MTNAITPTSCICNLVFHSQNETDSNLHSRLGIAFPLDSGASISVISTQTYKMITEMFNACNCDQKDTSKTFTFANKSEVAIKHFAFVTCFSSIEAESRYFMISFAVAVNKHNNLVTLFIEKYIQHIKIQVFTMNFKHSFNDQPTIASLTTLVKKNFIFVSFVQQKIQKTNI